MHFTELQKDMQRRMSYSSQNIGALATVSLHMTRFNLTYKHKVGKVLIAYISCF